MNEQKQPEAIKEQPEVDTESIQQKQATSEATELAEQEQAVTQLDDDQADDDQLDDEQVAEENVDDGYEKELSLCYQITSDDLYGFHLQMGKDQVAKNKKRTTIMGWIELAFGGMYLISLFIAGSKQPMQYLLSALLLGMGVYGVTFYQMRFAKSLRKATDKQHAKTPYFQKDILVDFYPNKCVEQLETKQQITLWRLIESVRVSPQAFIITLEKKRCLLIPRGGLGEQSQQVDDFLRKVCEDFEKPRYEE